MQVSFLLEATLLNEYPLLHDISFEQGANFAQMKFLHSLKLYQYKTIL